MLCPCEEDVTNKAMATAAHKPAIPRMASANRACFDEHTLFAGGAWCVWPQRRHSQHMPDTDNCQPQHVMK